MADSPSKKEKSDLPAKISRKFGRIAVDCAATIVFPFRNTHPRIKAHLTQIGRGGCGLSTDERLFIGEECLVWATGGGQKYLGAAGRIVWMRSIYEGHQTTLVGIEFKEPLALPAELLARLGAKQK